MHDFRLTVSHSASTLASLIDYFVLGTADIVMNETAMVPAVWELTF